MTASEFWTATQRAEDERKARKKPLTPFIVAIGPRDKPRLSFAAMGTDSASVFNQHVDLAEVNERVDVRPA